MGLLSLVLSAVVLMLQRNVLARFRIEAMEAWLVLQQSLKSGEAEYGQLCNFLITPV